MAYRSVGSSFSSLEPLPAAAAVIAARRRRAVAGLLRLTALKVLPRRHARLCRGPEPKTAESLVGIEGLTGPGLPNPCRRCRKHSTQPGVPHFAERVVVYRCPFCSTNWTRPFADGLYDDDVVRVDLDDGYLYGGVIQVDGDRVLVWVDEPPAPQQWFDRWRLIVY